MAKSLLDAKRAKKDEFYTQLTDIEKELRHYAPHFRGKTVFCNCDDPRVSNFFRYFSLKFEDLGLKKLITTCYKKYNEADYPKYDNYDAINVDITKEIPLDYAGAMGVPITFLDKYNPEQFEIVGIDRPLVEAITGKVSRFKINGKELFARIVIKHRRLGGITN